MMFISDLTSLPALVPTSALKKLIAIKSGIKYLPNNLFHYQLAEVDLRGNSGKERGLLEHDSITMKMIRI